MLSAAHKRRIPFVALGKKNEIANQLIGIMMYLNGEDEAKDIFLYVNNFGRAVLSGMSVYDATVVVNKFRSIGVLTNGRVDLVVRSLLPKLL